MNDCGLRTRRLEAIPFAEDFRNAPVLITRVIVTTGEPCARVCANPVGLSVVTAAAG